MKKRNLLLPAILLLSAAASVFAQASSLQPVDPRRESARATLTTFLDAFQAPRLGVVPDPLDEAVGCIDLEGIPADYRGVKGLEIAAQLHEVINAVEGFHVEDAPDAKTGDPFHVYTSVHGEIVVTRHANGEWLFTQETVRVVPLLVASIEEERRTHGTAMLVQEGSLGAQIRERMPPFLRQQTLGFERWQLVGLVLLVAIGLVVWQIARFIASLLIGPVLRRWYGGLTDEQIRGLYSPLGLLGFVVTFRMGLRALALVQSSLSMLRSAMFVLTAAAVIWIAYRVVDVVIYRLRRRSLETESQADDLLVPFIGAIARFTIVIVGAIVVAENLDFNVTGLIAGLGIGGIAIALASQETLSNFFGSLVLLIEQPFKAQDRVQVDGVTGTVKEVGLRSTRILTFDDSLVTVPNSNVAKANVINDGVRRYRRWVVKLSVPYKNRSAKVKKLCDGIEAIIRSSEALNNEVFKVYLFDIVPPSLIVRVEINFKEDDYNFELAARHRFIADVLELADELGVELEVPN